MAQGQITIRELIHDELALFRALRLQALEEAPEAFDQTYAVEKTKPTEYWQELLEALTPPSKNIMLIAQKEQEDVGVVYGFNKGSGKGSFGGMWVAKKHRNQGVASQLVEAVLQWAKGSEINTMNIWNVEGNQAAQKLYEKYGFQATGLSKKLESQKDRKIIQLKKFL